MLNMIVMKTKIKVADFCFLSMYACVCVHLLECIASKNELRIISIKLQGISHSGRQRV